MKLLKRLLLSGILILASACTPQAQQATPTPGNTNTLSPTSTATPKPSSTPILTFTPTSPPAADTLYSWPAAPLNQEQIQEVIDCQNATWSGGTEIDPQEIEIEDLVTPCDFGLNALSLIHDFDTLELSDLGIDYARQALVINPGIIFANPFFFFAFQRLEIVESPIPEGRIVEEIKINYTWSGIGSPVNYSVTITNGETPRAVGSVEIGPGPEEDQSETTRWDIQQEFDPAFLEDIGSARSISCQSNARA